MEKYQQYWLMAAQNFYGFNTKWFYQKILPYQFDIEKALANRAFADRSPLIQNIDQKIINMVNKWLENKENSLINFPDKNYPAKLREIASPPLLLFCKGNLALLNARQMAIVGSRKPSFKALKNTKLFSRLLVENGFVITSGFAYGIDTAAHLAALEAKGHTIAVLGNGIEHIYPRENEKLYQQICQNDGLIISEFPLFMPPKATNFPQRNRIISALSDGVLVIEAALKSGSLITARFALEQNREIFALPADLDNQNALGTNLLIQHGAKLVTKVEDVLEELPFMMPTNLPIAKAGDEHSLEQTISVIDPEEKMIIDAIQNNYSSIDELMLKTGLSFSQISNRLLSLEEKNMLIFADNRYYLK